MGANNEKEDQLINHEEPVPKVDQDLSASEENQKDIELPEKGLLTLLGAKSDTLKTEYGDPARIDSSAYGYEWWIYNNNLNEYFQVGILDNRVVSIYVIGPDTLIPPFKIGQPVNELFAQNMIQAEVSLDHESSAYKFELSEGDMNTRPLVPIGDFFAQLYIDKFTGKLSSARFVDAKTLIKQRPYELVYRGELLDSPELSEEQWQLIEKGAELQIFDITNVMRIRHGLNKLSWDEKTSEAAYGHSKEMYDLEYFSHTSETFGTLADRLKTANVFYRVAGENIAANYTDGPAVVEGWLNSKGHRDALLNSAFTHIGVGVYRKHYTQNFIEHWEE
ncbi:CAP domain-containing protein [Mesobacillus harenae]|uniref:CAP domain-containing protein n=1 Tax=Mesobacillus harenae TaxID=2213203 RepID=UPI00157FC130|nr:CAP domain-containing protein [Mesobacillus harenae]